MKLFNKKAKLSNDVLRITDPSLNLNTDNTFTIQLAYTPPNWTHNNLLLSNIQQQQAEISVEKGETLLKYVTAYRSWLVGLNAGQQTFFLRSTNNGHMWEPQNIEESYHIDNYGRYMKNLEIPWLTPIAECEKQKTKHDILNCVCGIYAVKQQCINYGTVCGEVALWGRVIEHEFGYKSQYAYPLSLSHLHCHGDGKKLENRNDLVAFDGSKDGFSIYCKKCWAGEGTFYSLGDIFDSIAKTYNIENHLLDC